MDSLLRGKVTYDARSFLVDGRRVWLHCGEIHYFRFSPGQWEETLRRARAAGLNTISTYVAWNWHEPLEGEISLAGDRDLGRYLDLIHSLGMYAVVRPGPYICSEWEGGGIPAWLHTKPGLVTRDDEAQYLAAVGRWFEKLLPIIAERQVSRGGPVILVQNENEYSGGWNDSTRGYIRKISMLLRGAGIDVPIIGCNAHWAPGDTVQINYSTDPADQILDDDLVITYNWGPGAEPVRDLRRKRPNAPLLMTEYWAGPQVFWGRQINDWVSHEEYARSMLEFASLGCQVTSYMFDGGTNFGFWGGGVVTSYQSNYPVREGGMPGEKYYRLKPVNAFITQFALELAGSDEAPDRLGFSTPASTRLVARSCPTGSLLFVTDPGRRPTTWIDHPEHGRLDVALPASRGMVLPLGLEVLPGLTLDHANVGLLGRIGDAGVVMLWGVPGQEAVIRANGKTTRALLPAHRVVELKTGRFRIVLVPEPLAERAWFMADRVVFGPELVDGGARVRCGERTSVVQVVSAEATRTFAAPEPAQMSPAPALGAWERRECRETDGSGDGWRELPGGPASSEELGHPYGYVWYRARFDSDEDGTRQLHLPRVTARVLVFANGSYCGVTGELSRAMEFCRHRHAADAFSQETVAVPVRRGANTIVFLCDNLGRFFDGLPDFMGLRADAYLGGERRPLRGARPIAAGPITEDVFHALYSKRYRKPEPLAGVETLLVVPEAADAWLALPNYLRDVAVIVDGRLVGAVGVSMQPFAYVRLPADTAGREVMLRLVSPSATDFAGLEGAFALLHPRRDRLGGWAWKPGEEPRKLARSEGCGSGAAASGGGMEWGGLVPEQVRTGMQSTARPAWLSTTFDRPGAELPLFLSIGRLHKGQIYVNGRNAGRFWQVGGYYSGNGVQDRYYIPGDWLEDRNSLLIFEEYGAAPDGTQLAWGDGSAWTGLEVDVVQGDARRR